jgi:hypothetical protein
MVVLWGKADRLYTRMYTKKALALRYIEMGRDDDT